MKFNTLLILLFAFVLFSCDKEDEQSDTNPNQQVDLLQQSGIMGKWEIQTREYDNIMDMTVYCCEFIQFESDSSLNDWQGSFSYMGHGDTNLGTFVVDTSKAEVLIQLETRNMLCVFSVDNTTLNLSYPENNQTISETYVKK